MPVRQRLVTGVLVTSALLATLLASPAAAGAADLVITAVSRPPTGRTAGTTFAVTDTTRNRGTAKARRSATRFYLSRDTVRGSDVALAGARAVGALYPSTGSNGRVVVAIPRRTAPASYRLLACADAGKSVAESNEKNNCRVSASAVKVAGLADLSVSSVTAATSSVAAGQSISVTDTTRNSGWVAAAKTATRYYLSTDGSRGAGDVALSPTQPVPALVRGASSKATRAVSVPASVRAGTYRVLACGDGGGTVTEISETNNCRASAETLKVTSAPAAWPADAAVYVIERGDEHVVLSWSPASGSAADGGYVIRSGDATVATVPAGELDARVSGLTPDTARTFRVMARRSAGTLAAGPALTVTTLHDVRGPLNLDLGSGQRATTMMVNTTASAQTVNLTAADGTKYSLLLPQGSLRSPEAIRLEAVASASGLPAGSFVAGVRFEPEGLLLTKPATLTITPVNPPPLGEEIPLAFAGSGINAHLVPLDPTSSAYRLTVEHFSGVLIARGTGVDRGLVSQYVATAEQQIAAQTAGLLIQERVRKLQGQPSDPELDAQLDALSDAEFDGMHGLVLAAIHNEEIVDLALTVSQGWLQRRRDLGLPDDDRVGLLHTAWQLIVGNAWNRAYDRCLRNANPMEGIRMLSMRQVAIVRELGLDLDVELAIGCMLQELDVSFRGTNELRFYGDTAQLSHLSGTMTAQVRAVQSRVGDVVRYEGWSVPQFSGVSGTASTESISYCNATNFAPHADVAFPVRISLDLNPLRGDPSGYVLIESTYVTSGGQQVAPRDTIQWDRWNKDPEGNCLKTAVRDGAGLFTTGFNIYVNRWAPWRVRVGGTLYQNVAYDPPGWARYQGSTGQYQVDVTPVLP